METLDKCNLCNGGKNKIIETYHSNNKIFTFVECIDCGLAFMNPRPSKDEMVQYYADYGAAHYHKFKDPAFIKRLYYLFMKQWLSFRYTGSIYNILAKCLLPFELHWRWIVWCNLLYDIKKIGKILDIGCGNGCYLGQMRLYGFECYGCEPDPIRAKTAGAIKGVNISATDLHAAQYPDGFFNVVHIWNVLEHVHDPMAVLQEANRILKRNGLIVISSPNRECVLNYVFPNREDVPRHLYIFSYRTIRCYLEKSGFSITCYRTGGDPYSIYARFYEATIRYLKEKGTKDQLVSADNFWRSKMRRFEYRPTRQFFSKLGAGHAFFVAAVKNNCLPDDQ